MPESMTGKNDPTKWEDLILDTLRPEEAEEASRQEAVRAAEGNSNEDSPIEFSKDPLQLDPSDNYAEVMTYLQTKPVPRKRTTAFPTFGITPCGVSLNASTR